jgi:DNA-binding LytR/AlgR family response regulator
MKFVIIEDEMPSYENLAHKLRVLQPNAWIYPQLMSVESALFFFNEKLPYDLVFADVHLQDGKSIDAFRLQATNAPIVFITAHNNYMEEAFDLNGIDYLLKPVDIQKLKKTLEKYNGLKSFFNPTIEATEPLKTRERIIVKRGNDFQPLPVEDIVYLFSENKLVFAVDRDKKKFLCTDNNLSELMEELNTAIFFRANRKYIINIKFLEKFYSIERSRVVTKMTIAPQEDIIISQENASAFRNWVER